jgi:hypothetical protein
MTGRTDPWTRVARLWPLLAMTRIPGTPRPWRPAELTGAQREERDAKLRAERLADTASYPQGLRWLARPGVIFASPHAPLHVDVLDTLASLWLKLIDAGWEFEQSAPADAPARPPLQVHGALLRDPGPLLEWCRERARSQPDGVPVDHAAWDMLHVIEKALGEIWSGQKLTADCPWCHGGIAGKPSWRVRVLPPDMPAIVCESGTCEPPDADADRWRGMPAWPMWEWDWLAQQLESEEQRQAARRAAIVS